MAGRTILVAEDDVGVRRFLVTVLERKGYQVVAAADGSKAMSILADKAIAIDVILSDVDMPGASGLEVLAFARRRRPGSGAILASGTNLWTADQVAAGVTLLQKPFTIDQVLDAIEAVLPS